MLKFFDAHTHIQFAAFKDDYREVVERALAAGVGMINIGTQKDTSRRAVEIAHEFQDEPVYAAVGLHPIHTFKSHHDVQELGVIGENQNADRRESAPQGFTSRAEDFDYEYYKELALDPKVAAIGECGFDHYRVKSNEQGVMSKQKEAFLRQMELAHEVKKPLMIHCRSAYDDLIDILITHNSLLITDSPGVIHFFSGTVSDAKKLLEMGFYFTFGGIVTFIRDYDEVIKIIPIDRILSETDAPYVSPVPYRGKRNEPAYVVEVVKKLAEIKGMPLEKIRTQILENAKKVFKLA